ncbi:hypothetical protein [Sphingomonas azotifigens]|uniref:hypothetical protein n=1 Tax=Sphingomonas azotifigens TaxID=330920 RepID=UPI001FE870FA|nr:hypothetical protein [Sphingomonas azotifigens]
MKTSPTRASRLAIAAALLAAVGVPAFSQQQKAPESLLPPGFDQPAPRPQPSPRPTPAPSAAPAAAPSPSGDMLSAGPDTGPDAFDVEESNASVVAAPAIDLSQYDLPKGVRRPLDRVGILAAGNAPFPADAFGKVPAATQITLMRRLDAPVASRWVSIALRRALMSPLDTPAGVDGADYAAERAWLLLRMGEATAARGLVSYVDIDDYTNALDRVAMQVALATGDPAAVCPIVDDAAAAVPDRGWALAQAICAGLAGKPSEADQRLDAAAKGKPRNDIDTLLATKVVGMGADSRRAVTIDWVGVPALSAWRFGMATAAGADIPDNLFATVGPHYRYWQALSPLVAPALRAPAAELAAAAGVLSNAALVDLYAEIDQASDVPDPLQKTARDLRSAYTGSPGERVQAMRSLWDAAETPRLRYARLVLTAKAAAWVPANKNAAEPDRLIASMLSAGYESAALQWRGVVAPGSEGWALLALVEPAGAIGYADFERYAGAASPRKAAMLLAGLAGLGRLAPADAQRGAEATKVGLGGVNAWTQAIDRAGAASQPGMVALLAGVGMQSPRWDQVTPEALYHIVAAMRAAGMANYARMIAVEAVTRAA